ncbi:MAG: DNA primase [Saprospiraceae bacterium]|nr:DNA primase [Saprospiraceae bacterium]
MIKQGTIEKIMTTAKVEEVVEDFVNLKRRGVNMIGNCPFHDEKTPSFTVSPAKNIYKCFGCGKAGDPVRFMMEHEAMNYPEALRYLAGKYNIEIEETENTAEEKAYKELTASYFIINEFAQKYFEENLFRTDEGKSVGLGYFKERGYNEQIIRKFQLGYTTRDRDDLTKRALQKRFNPEFLKKLGLTSKSNYDFFRSRVMFTIHNLSGKVIAFAGRTLSKDKKTPKYINSPETDIYNKRKVLYGMYFAKQAIRKLDECIMVEGYTDVITLHQYGIENVVASSGTSLTVEQIGLVRRYTPNIKIIYDGDTAGVKAALRGLDLVLEQDMNVRLVLLPEGEDPDSYLKKVGIEAFRAYLKDHEEDFLFFKTNLLLKEAGDDPIRKSQVLKDIVRSIAKIPDMIKKSLYLKKCSDIMDISEEILVAETNKAIKADLKQKRNQYQRNNPDVNEDRFISAPKKQQGEKVKNLKQVVTGDDYQEKDLLRVLISMGNQKLKADSDITVAGFLISNIEDELDSIDNPLFKRLFGECIQQYKDVGRINIEAFTSSDDETTRNLVIDLLSSPYIYAGWEEKGLQLQTQKDPENNQEMDSLNSLRRFLYRKYDKKVKLIETKIIELSGQAGEEENLLLYMKAHKKALEFRSDLANQLGSVFLR